MLVHPTKPPDSTMPPDQSSLEKIRKGDRKRERGNRTGFTTGANSAAAAMAATLGLVEGVVPARVVCTLPNGRQAAFAISDGRTDGKVAHAVSIKDAGDDPDATHGAHLTADVRRLLGAGGEIVLLGGAGIGMVTKPGLGLEVGGAAINPAPRKNIVENVRTVGSQIFQDGDGLEVTISVPGGEEMAKKTLNARLGILGGISILGTTGIVRPYSTAAFRASVVQAVDVAANQGQTTVVFTTGGRTEKCAMREFAQLDAACFVQMGDFVKAALQRATDRHMQHIIIGAMVGKLAKIAQGLSVTHAWRGEVNRDLVALAAAAAGASPDLAAEIRAAATARFAAERMNELDMTESFHRELALSAIRTLRSRFPGEYRLTVLACDFEGRCIVIVEEDR